MICYEVKTKEFMQPHKRSFMFLALVEKVEHLYTKSNNFDSHFQSDNLSVGQSKANVEKCGL